MRNLQGGFYLDKKINNFFKKESNVRYRRTNFLRNYFNENKPKINFCNGLKIPTLNWLFKDLNCKTSWLRIQR